jgi:hypothetical protein
VPSDWKPQIGGVPMTVRCERCNMERRDSISRATGDVMSRRYTYPTGYQFTNLDDPTTRPSRTDWRMSWIESEVENLRQRRRDRRAS